jgi:hypothetical protein
MRIANAYPAPGACTTGSAIVWALVGTAVGFGLAMLILEAPAKTVYTKARAKAKKYFG